MLKPGDAVLAAVSGGADSIALVHILLKLSPEFDLRLGIAHFDHGLRAWNQTVMLSLSFRC
jgi:tRNA(Ile)-lysidine synthase